MAFYKFHFRRAIVDVCRALSPKYAHRSAVNLVLGTAAQESGFGTYLRQLDEGPARGVFQMEPATERDIWESYLFYDPDLKHCVLQVTGVGKPDQMALELNLAYQIAMCRLHYYRVSEALPESEDIQGLARYWKRHYNTHLGKGTQEEFMLNYRAYIGD